MKEEMNEEFARRKINEVRQEVKKWLFGIDRAIDKSIMCLFTLVPYTSEGRKEFGQAHALLTDLPGTGKTDLIRSLAAAIGAKSSFISGGPEKTESEILGSAIYIAPLGKFFLRNGPIFSNIVLFDEINRTHPKGQSAFLQAMEERLAMLESIDLETGQLIKTGFPLFPIPEEQSGKKLFFWVLSARNPIEQEGTYPLPEAQLDRFTASFSIGFPKREDEKRIRARNVIADEHGGRIEIKPVLNLEEVLDISRLIVETVVVPSRDNEGSGLVDDYIMRLIENSRPGTDGRQYASDNLKKFIDENLEAGVSPRANFHFEALARTQAFFAGRKHIAPDDVKRVAPLIMEHRLTLSPIAIGAGITAKKVVEEILCNTEVSS